MKKTSNRMLINAEIKVGDSVYYINHHKDSIPAIVRQVGRIRLLIAGNFLEGNKCVWVKATNCELQTGHSDREKEG